MQVSGDGLALARFDAPHRDAEGAAPSGVALELRARELGDLTAILQGEVRSAGLAGAAARLVLSPDDYALLQVPRPDGPDEVLAEALRWSLGEQLPVPPADAVVQVLPMPDAYRDRNVVHLVVAHRTRLEALAGMLREAQLEPAGIGIAELALRDLVGLTEFEDHGLLAVLLMPWGGLLNVTRAGTLFLTRRLPVAALGAPPDTPPFAQMVEQIAEHVDTSLDFFEAQLRQATPSAAFVLAPQSVLDALLGAFRERLRVPVRALSADVLTGLDVTGPDGSACAPEVVGLPAAAAVRALGAER